MCWASREYHSSTQTHPRTRHANLWTTQNIASRVHHSRASNIGHRKWVFCLLWKQNSARLLLSERERKNAHISIAHNHRNYKPVCAFFLSYVPPPAKATKPYVHNRLYTSLLHAVYIAYNYICYERVVPPQPQSHSRIPLTVGHVPAACPPSRPCGECSRTFCVWSMRVSMSINIVAIAIPIA